MTSEGKYDDRRDVWIAPADTLKGQLQRGRGAGFLAALEVTADELCPLLLDIIANDPRWDPQVESHAEMYADLMIHARMPFAEIEQLVRAHTPSNRWFSEFLPFTVVEALGERGDPRALDLMHDLARNSANWSPWFSVLVRIGTPRALEGLDEVLMSRAVDDDDLESELPWDEDEGPWPMWRRKHPRIDAGMRARKAELARDATVNASLEGLALEELLLSDAPDHGNPRAGEFVVSRIADVVRPSDLPVLVRHLDPSNLKVCRRALGALRYISSPAAFDALREFVEANPNLRLGCMVYVGRALEAQPAELALQLGRVWFEHPDWPYSAWGLSILAEHATYDDIPLLASGLAQCCADPAESYRACGILEALRRLPAAGRLPDVERAFIEAHYSRLRQEAAHAMHVTDPQTYVDRFARECLWDCRDAIQLLGIATVDRFAPGVRARLSELTAGAFRNRDVVEAARGRIAGA